MPAFRHANTRTDVIADPLPALICFDGSEHVEADLEPGVKAMRDLERFVLRMVGGIKTILKLLRAINGKIAVQFKHGVAGFDGVRAIHLNLVVILGRASRRPKYHQQRTRQEESAKLLHSASTFPA